MNQRFFEFPQEKQDRLFEVSQGSGYLNVHKDDDMGGRWIYAPTDADREYGSG